MKIKNITINAVGGIAAISLPFNDKMNIICGPNGIGKTTILESIAHLFTTGQSTILKRNVKFEASKIEATAEINDQELNTKMEFDGFSPEKINSFHSNWHPYSDKLLVLKTNRTFDYHSLQSVSKDIKKEGHIIWESSRSGLILTEVKNWFVNRYLYSAHPEALTTEQLANFELAKSAFSLLNKDFSFSKVEASSNEIMTHSPSGEIYYEYLSSGFKSILSIIFGIIKEIEYRFVEPRIEASNFDGIIIIDELELHLHPEWQEQISRILLEIFPKVQFITTTHSPHIIQFAEPNQVIALGLSEGDVVRRQLIDKEYGFQGWTIEEILTDVMDMQDTRTRTFKTIMADFESAIEKEDYQSANTINDQLDAMLHPQNILRKLIKFQLLSIKNIADDKT